MERGRAHRGKTIAKIPLIGTDPCTAASAEIGQVANADMLGSRNFDLGLGYKKRTVK
jgi:hypothetical protein